jgi:hypothetical protein
MASMKKSGMYAAFLASTGIALTCACGVLICHCSVPLQDGDEADIRAITPTMLHGQVDAPYVLLVPLYATIVVTVALFLVFCEQRKLATPSPTL